MAARADVMTIDELANYLRIPKATLYKLAQQGKVPSQKVGRQWRFHRPAVDRWLQETRGSSDAATRTSRREIRGESLTRDPIPNDPVLAEIVRRLVEAYQPDRIYLFGSKARGEAGPDSDYDLLVVVSDEAPPERQRSRLAYEHLWGTGTAADVLVWTRTQFESRAHLAASLPATVLREGKLLHAA